MVPMFEDKVYEGTVPAEPQAAIKYCQSIVCDQGMEPLGITCPKAAAKDIHTLFQRSPMPKQMAFSGTIWMLDLDHRLQTVDSMDFARMRWTLEHIVEKQSVNKMLGKVVVRAESVPSAGGFQNLRRVERDADIDAVVLVIYWNKPQDANAVHPWMSELRDLMFSAEPVGSGVEVAVDRFFRYEEEEKKRDFMGLSALRRAQELERLVQQGEAQRNGMCDAELAANLLATKPSLIKNGAKIHVRDIWP